ncbi:MAG: FimB/Mfa2 family fimbrial subunit [Alistipes sp.]
MKKIVYICALCLALAACQQDDLDAVGGAGPAMLTLNLSAESNQIQSRAVSSDAEEQIIHNVYLFIFNQDGSKAFSKFYANINVENTTTLARITNIPSGTSKTIAALANIDNSIVDVTQAKLDAITTKAALEALTSRIKGDFVERGSAFLMSGLKDGVTLTAGQNTAISIPMYRVDAKIRFNITTPNGVSFTPQDWRVVAVPKMVSVLPTTITDQFPFANNYFNTPWFNFEVSAAGDNTFAFYVLENKISPLTQIPATGTAEAQYALREKKNKDANGLNLDFHYARPAATYVELRGNVKYTDVDTSTPVSADVVYTIHLGAAKNVVNDYNSLRNTFYTYTVQIQSVDKIRLEVTTDREERPGAEGHVVLPEVVKNFDAHNEVFPITFHYKDIFEKLTWQVITPFSNGAEEAGKPLPADSKWIRFGINTKSGGVYTTAFVKYLGDQNVYTDVELNLANPAAALTRYMADITAGRQKMLYVNQLLVVMKESKKQYDAVPQGANLFDTAKNISFTAFLSDFYYEANPNNPTETVQNGLWKKFVNEKERMINILTELTYSKDGMSSQSKAYLSVRQASIQTMYNKFLTTNFTAWGSQMIQDPNPLPFDNKNALSTNYSDERNGRLNSLHMWLPTAHKWDDYIVSTTWKMQTAYELAKYKCLRCNRDMNGNGNIDPEEVQWYLASINQVTDMWIGENSYNNNARLYTLSTWNERWYVSSTVPSRSSSKDNPLILWSSEGSSVGGLDGATNGISARVYYRCVRNLGLSPTAAETVLPVDFATYDPTTRTINLDKLDEKSIRGFSTVGELADHNERDVRGYNKPWTKFEINAATSGNNLTWEAVRARSQPGGTNPVCPVGWRVPNQRELSLMYSRMPKNNTSWPLRDHFSRTAFSFSPSTRPGFSVTTNAGVLYLLNGSDASGGVRCVRDVIE